MQLSVPAGRVAVDCEGAIAESVMTIEQALFRIPLYGPGQTVTNQPFFYLGARRVEFGMIAHKETY